MSEEGDRKVEVSPPPPLTSGEQSDPWSDQSQHHVTGRLDTLTEHINAHLRLYRMLPWALGTVGALLLLRHTRVPWRRLRQVSDLPSDLVKENGRISGVVMTTGWNTVGVWHVPSWRWVFRWGTRPPKDPSADELLTVQFSGVAIGDPNHATLWLKERLLGKKVWLTLLDHTSPLALDQKAVQCVVHINKKGLLKWRKTCVNEEMLASGVGSVREVTGVIQNADYVKLTSSLVKSEKLAKTRGKGVWRGTEHVTMWNRIKNVLFRRK